MQSDWELLTLQDAGISLIDCVHKTPPAADAGYPYIAIPQMVNGRLDLQVARKISAGDLAEWTKKAKPQAHDIVLSRRCNPGETAYVAEGENFALGQNLVLLRADGKTVYPPFLRWLTRGLEWWEQIGKNLNVGAVFDSLKCADVPKFTLTIPPIDEQKAIAAALGALDDKIEQNRRTSQALEKLARATFKAWFVDFEPVKAKAAGQTSFPGMPAAAFAALPDRLTDSAIGPVPEGWEVKVLEEVSEAVKGLSYKGAGLVPVGTADLSDSLPLHNLNSVYEGGGYKNEGIKRYRGEYKDRHIIYPGDLIVTNTEQGHEYRLIGFPAIVPQRFGERGLFSHHIFRVRPLAGSALGVHFLYHAMMTGRIRDEIVGCTNGTTVNMLSIDGLKRPRVCVPPAAITTEFEQKAAAMYDLSESQRDESAKLAEMRDYLLPRLLSGRVRVTSIQKGDE